MLRFRLLDPLYGRKIFVIVGCNHARLQKYIKDECGAEMDQEPFVLGETFAIANNSEKIFFVWIEKFNWTIVDQGIMAHELLHLTFKILEEVGISLTDESDEAYTYLFEELLCRTWNHLNKYNDKIHKRQGLRKKARVRNGSKKRHARRKTPIRLNTPPRKP